MSTPDVITLGCRLNAYESEQMRASAAAAGLTDAVVVNTCAVTAEAVRQAAQTIRRVRRERPGARIIVTGCAAQIEPERFAGMPEVDHVIGNGEKTRPETFLALAAGAEERVRVNDIMEVRDVAPHMAARAGARTRAFVQVQNGCDHRCTFCIIPFGRGPSRSVPMGAVVAEIERLVADGVAEVVLTGVDITSYGGDLPGSPKLGSLVRRILRHVPGLARLRLSSIDQTETDPALLAAIAEEPRLMPHLHLSLQAGDDLVLKRMKRRHMRADAVRFCREVRALRPDVAFGADLIAGFPTESEEMFLRTLALVEDCGLSYLHVFPYSARPGTPAARMPQVPKPEIKERAARLRQCGENALSRHLSGKIGQHVPVLLEEGRMGRVPDFAEIDVVGCGDAPGPLLERVRVTGAADRRLVGEVVR